MNKTEFQNNLKSISNSLNKLILEDNSTCNDIKFNPFEPVRMLFKLINEEISKDEDYKNQIVEWLKEPCTLKTRKICARFETAIKKRFDSDERYPMPFDNAEERLCLLNWRKL